MTGQDAKPKIPLKRRLAYLALIYLSFLAVLALVELGTRIALPNVSSLQLFVSTPQQIAQVADAKQASIFEGDPLLLWRLKPNLNHVVWDFTVLSTNAQHLRGDYPVKAKEDRVFRIVCLGDSVTFGYRVPVVWPDKPTEYDRSWLPYPMLLEQQLRAANPNRKVEVITMAVPGYTSHQGLAWLRSEIDVLKPDLLVASFGWNDVSLSDAPDREAIRTDWYVVGVRWLIDHSQAFAHATKWLRSGKQSSKPVVVRPMPRVSESEYVQNMSEITRVASEHGARTILLGAPYRDGVTNVPEAQLMTRYRSSLHDWATNNQIPFLEIRELTEAAHPSNQGWFGELIHPNHMGHRLIAAELLKLLAAGELLDGLKVPELTP